jgi:predicted esterase
VWAPGKYFWKDRTVAIAELATHLAALQAPEQTVLAGFSMGAGLAIQAVLGGTLGVRRFLAVAPAIRLEAVLPLLATCSPEVRGHIIIGEQDRYCPAAVELANAMKQAGLKCELELHAQMGHDFPPAFPSDLDRRLTALC